MKDCGAQRKRYIFHGKFLRAENVCKLTSTTISLYPLLWCHSSISVLGQDFSFAYVYKTKWAMQIVDVAQSVCFIMLLKRAANYSGILFHKVYLLALQRLSYARKEWTQPHDTFFPNVIGWEISTPSVPLQWGMMWSLGIIIIHPFRHL